MTCDGHYLYIHNAHGLSKIGSGFGGTIKGHVYIHRPDFYPKQKGWLGFAHVSYTDIFLFIRVIVVNVIKIPITNLLEILDIKVIYVILKFSYRILFFLKGDVFFRTDGSAGELMVIDREVLKVSEVYQCVTPGWQQGLPFSDGVNIGNITPDKEVSMIYYADIKWNEVKHYYHYSVT